MSSKPILREGTGYGNNIEMKEFIQLLLEKEIIINKGGIMKPGVFLNLNGENYNISKMSVEELKEILTEYGIDI